MNELELLRAYKAQNPIKYKQKYGDQTPEEASGQIRPIIPTIVNGVRIDMVAKTEKEVEFKTEVAETSLEPEKPKKIRKAKEERNTA